MLLKELSEAFGVSGEEDAVRKIVLGAIKDHVDEYHIDSIGNVTAVKKGTGENKLRVMIDAHMDEVGFMITDHDNNGMMHFTNIGGIDDRILPGMRVRIGPDGIPGVITWVPIHKGYSQNVKKMSDLRIDIGVSSKDAAKGKVKRGARVTFDSQFMEIGTSMLRGKAFDDRGGCALLIDILQGGPYPVDILAAFTVQEEIGLRGAQVAAQRLNPDVAIALECTTAHDVPNPDADPDDPTSVNPACKVGAGPVLTVMDRSMITPPQLLQFMKETAQADGIPFQIKTALGGGTDAGRIHLTNGGVPSMVVSVPCRYIHSPNAYMNRDDYANTLKLVQAALGKLSADLIKPL